MRALLLLAATACAAAATPELLPVHEGKPKPEPETQGIKRALLSIEATVNASAVDPFRIVYDGGVLVGQVTSDPVTVNYTNSTELCIFLNESIPVDNETYTVEAVARVDDVNGSLVVVFDASPQVVNASYYCTNVTDGTFYTALVQAAAPTAPTPTADDDETTDTTTGALAPGVIAGIVIGAVTAAALLTIVLVLAIRPRPERIVMYEPAPGTVEPPLPPATGEARMRMRDDDMFVQQRMQQHLQQRRVPLRFNTGNLRR